MAKILSPSESPTFAIGGIYTTVVRNFSPSPPTTETTSTFYKSAPVDRQLHVNQFAAIADPNKTVSSPLVKMNQVIAVPTQGQKWPRRTS